MTGENIFYVYEHWRPDKDVCFYVGKGKYPKRAFDIKNRTRWHKAVTSKLTFLGLCTDVRIISRDLSEENAFKLEVDRIAYWRMLGVQLVNLTNGGEGCSGGKISEETRSKMRAAAAIRNSNPIYLGKLRIATTATWEKPGYREKVLSLMVGAQKNISRGPCAEETKRKIGDANRGKKKPPLSQEVRNKIGASQRGKIIQESTKRKIAAANLGKKRTPEQIQRMLARPPMSPETRAKIGAKSRGNKFMLGKSHSDETKNKLRQLGLVGIETFKKYSHMGPKAQAKKVICIDDGRIFESANAAAKYYGLKHGSSITEVCLGKKYRYSAAGKTFKYTEAA